MPMYNRALEIWETLGQMESSDAIAVLGNLGEIYSAQGDYAGAEPFFLKVLESKEREFGPNSLQVAGSASRLALLYYCESKYEAAEPLYKQALQNRQLNLGAKDPVVLQTMQVYAALLRQEGRKDEAQKVEAQSARSETRLPY